MRSTAQNRVLAGRWSGPFGRCVVAAGLAWLGTYAGCERDQPPASRPGAPAPADPDRVLPPASKPEYQFAEPLRDEYPEVVAFMQQFLETCLAGDYGGYRRLVSRQCNPESRDRFQAVLQAIAELRITSIEPLDSPQLSDEVYAVTSQVRFQPDSKVRLRRRHDALGILVLKEQGQWRMIPAPAELQPDQDEAPATSSAPSTSAPSYPWDEDGNF